MDLTLTRRVSPCGAGGGHSGLGQRRLETTPVASQDPGDVFGAFASFDVAVEDARVGGGGDVGDAGRPIAVTSPLGGEA